MIIRETGKEEEKGKGTREKALGSSHQRPVLGSQMVRGRLCSYPQHHSSNLHSHIAGSVRGEVISLFYLFPFSIFSLSFFLLVSSEVRTLTAALRRLRRGEGYVPRLPAEIQACRAQTGGGRKATLYVANRIGPNRTSCLSHREAVIETPLPEEAWYILHALEGRGTPKNEEEKRKSGKHHNKSLENRDP